MIKEEKKMPWQKGDTRGERGKKKGWGENHTEERVEICMTARRGG